MYKLQAILNLITDIISDNNLVMVFTKLIVAYDIMIISLSLQQSLFPRQIKIKLGARADFQKVGAAAVY